MRTEKKLKLKQLRHWRIRKRVSGTPERPRMSVRFTNENIHVQFIDDVAGKTLAADFDREQRRGEGIVRQRDRREESRRARGEGRDGQGHHGGGV